MKVFFTINLLTSVVCFVASYSHVGCYKDRIIRALPVKLGNYGSVQECFNVAKGRGYRMFGVQYGSECWSAPNAESRYKIYGAASGCSNGKGGTWMQDIYRIN